MAHFGPLWLQQGSYSAGSDRRLIGALWPSGGVTGMAVSPGGSGMSLAVAPGSCAVPTPNNTGSTLCATDAVDNSASCPAAPASGLNRYDVVTVLPRGNDLDGGANNDWILNVISGTAVASPTVPAVPAGQLALAQIYVPGGSASVSAGNITDLRVSPLAVPMGAIHYVGNPGEPPFQNGFANIGGGTGPARFCLQGTRVMVEGGITGGPTSGSATIFTLPVGYRPTATHNFWVRTASADVGLTVSISPTGAVAFTATASTSQFVSLDSLNFDIR
jgi:hypothetical protein